MDAVAAADGAEAGVEEEAGAACNATEEDPRTAAVRYYCYGVALPAVCALGIIGNALNLLVLTRRNMKGTAYVYMRGYAAASLLAIAFAIPFGVRVLEPPEGGRWASRARAFYHVHLELFLGNACLGVGVLMLLALTVERYVAVCHPGRTRPLVGPPRRVVALIPLFTFAAYLPGVFRARLGVCLLPPAGDTVYVKVDNGALLGSAWHAVYVVLLEAAFKVGPTLLLAALNLRILVVYRRSCERRRRRCARASHAYIAHAQGNGKGAGGAGDPHHPPDGGGAGGAGDPRSGPFAEERRLVLLLGSTSILFLVCVSPMVILNVTLSERNLSLYSYQVFRAVANLLEVTNYSLTFYIYCLFSEDFRSTLLRTLRWPWRCCAREAALGARGPGGGGRSAGGGRGGAGVAVSNGGKAPPQVRRCTPPTTTTTTTTATTGASGGGAPSPLPPPPQPPPEVPAPAPRPVRLGLCCGATEKAEERAAV